MCGAGDGTARLMYLMGRQGDVQLGSQASDSCAWGASDGNWCFIRIVTRIHRETALMSSSWYVCISRDQTDLGSHQLLF